MLFIVFDNERWITPILDELNVIRSNQSGKSDPDWLRDKIFPAYATCSPNWEWSTFKIVWS